jgi:preprotein translocase SecY subunit
MMTLSLARWSDQGRHLFYYNVWYYYPLVVMSLTAGTAFLMWLGEQITDKGIGNGVSLIIFAGIVLRFPDYIGNTFKTAQMQGPSYYVSIVLFLIITVLLIMSIIMINQGQRRVPVQYAKRQVGRRVYGGQSTYIPIRINNAGVISIIFAISIMYLPTTFTGFLKQSYAHREAAINVLPRVNINGTEYDLSQKGLTIPGIKQTPQELWDNLKKLDPEMSEVGNKALLIDLKSPKDLKVRGEDVSRDKELYLKNRNVDIVDLTKKRDFYLSFVVQKTAPRLEWWSHAVNFVDRLFDPGGWFYNLCYALLVIFFTYFYSAITFNIMDVADNMKKYGGFVPGIRPGRPTAEYLDRILGRITFVSAFFLAFIAVAPTYVMKLTNVHSFYLGSTSILIIVGVALDTMQQIEARLVMRHYQGFMK